MMIQKNARIKVLRFFIAHPHNNFSYEDLLPEVSEFMTKASLQATMSKFVAYFGKLLIVGTDRPYLERVTVGNKTYFKWNVVIEDPNILPKLYEKFKEWERGIVSGRRQRTLAVPAVKKPKEKVKKIKTQPLGMVEDFVLDEKTKTVVSSSMPKEIAVTVKVEGAIRFLFGLAKE